MFTKNSYSPNVSIGVTLPTRPGDEYVFTFPKRLPQTALDAEEAFVGLDKEERADAFRLGLVRTVAAMLVTEPQGFGDFPVDERPLAERALEYFADPAEPEFEAILVKAWGGFREVTRATAYLKSVQADGAAVGDVQRTTAAAPPEL